MRPSPAHNSLIQTQRELEHHRERAHQYLNLAGVIFIALDRNARITLANPRACQTLGYTEAELIGTDWIATFIPPADQDAVRGIFNSLIAGDLNFAECAEHYIINRHGNRRLIAWHNALIRDDADNIVGTLNSGEDITERQRALDELRTSEEAYRRIVETANEGIWSMDADFHTTFVNTKMTELLGYHPDEMLGRPVTDFMAPDDLPDHAAQMRARRRGRNTQYERRFLRKDGSTILLLVSATVLRDDAGRFAGSFAMFTDLSAREQAADELRRYRRRLEEMVQQRTQQLEESREQLRRSERLASIGTLAAGIAHEINNPLGIILLEADHGLLHCDSPQTTQAAFEQIKDQVKRCSRIVKNVLRFARDQSTDKWSIDLLSVLSRAIDFTREKARQNSIRIQSELPDQSLIIHGNPTELEQVFVNLIENAINACTEQGRITITAAHHDHFARVAIRDNGQGMTAAQRKRAFDPFYTTRGEQGGTGLGLSTCHGIVSDHEGTIDIRSRPSRSTTLTVTLPLVAPRGATGE